MAVLKIDVVVDDNGASAKLSQIDKSVKGIETASMSASAAVTKASAAHGAAANASVSAFSKMGTAFGSFAKTVGAFVTADLLSRMIAGFSSIAKGALDSASKLTDMSAKTGLTMKTLQQMEHVANQTGASLDEFANAAFMLGVKVEKGTKGTRLAVEALGLSFNDLRAMSPDDMFNTVAVALGKIEDPTMRNRIAMELFGKTAKAIMPAIVEGYGDMAHAATVAGDAQIRALDNAGDAWDRLTQRAATAVMQQLGDLALGIEGFQQIGLKGMLFSGRSILDAPERLRKAALDAQEQKRIDDWWNNPVAASGGSMLSQEDQTAADREAKSAANELRREAEAIRKRRDQMSGASDIADAKEMLSDMRAVGGLTRLTDDATEALHTTLGKAIAAYERLGQVAPRAMHDAWVATMQTPKMITGGLNAADFAKADAGIPWTPELLPRIGMTDGVPAGVGEQMAMPGMPVKPDSFFQTAFGGAGGLGGGLMQTIMGSLMGGGSISGALGGFLGGNLMNGLSQHLTAGMSGTIGKMLGSFLPGIGALLGPLIGKGLGKVGDFFGGLFGKKSKAEKETISTREDFAKQFGGIEKLKDTFEELGLSSDKFFSTKKPKELAAEIDKLNVAMEKQKELQAGIAMIGEGVNARAANVTTQGDLDVVSAGAAASFGLQMGQGASAVEAINTLTPALTAMRDAMAGGNFEMSAAGARLLELAAIIEANRIPFQNLAADGQILQGMMQGNIRDFDLFKAVATDIGVQMQGMIDKGVPTAQVLALAQPQLQALWEAQQKWHFELDGTTQALMDQAVQQGMVGQAMKSVNQQILDVLMGIAKVLGADIPGALAGLPAAAQNAAKGMNDAFGSVQPPDMGGGLWNPEAWHMDENGEYQPPSQLPGTFEGAGITHHEGQQEDPRFRNLTVNVQGSLVHESELGAAVTNAVIEAVRLNKNSSFTGLRAALEMPT
jgi:hypothetical protein